MLACRELCLESQSSTGLGINPYHPSPDLVWPGHLHGTGCLSARAMDTGFPIVVWCLCLGLGSAVTPPFLAGVYGACGWARVSALPRHFWLGIVVRAFGVGFSGNPATPGSDVGCVCLDTGFGRGPPFLAGVRGVCVLVPVLPALHFLSAYVLGRVASCVRRVRFSPPSGEAACGVGVCGGCRGWGLSPPLPFCLFSRAAVGVCGFRPCGIMAVWCLPLPVLVLGLLVPVPPSPFVWAAPMSFFFLCPPLLERSVCRCVRGVLSSAGPLLSTGCQCPFGGPCGRRLRCCLAGGFARLLWSGCAASWLCVCLLPRPFFSSVLFFFFSLFLGGGLPVPPYAFPLLVHSLVGIRCG